MTQSDIYNLEKLDKLYIGREEMEIEMEIIMSNSIVIAHQRGERDASLERNWRAINE